MSIEISIRNRNKNNIEIEIEIVKISNLHIIIIQIILNNIFYLIILPFLFFIFPYHLLFSFIILLFIIYHFIIYYLLFLHFFSSLFYLISTFYLSQVKTYSSSSIFIIQNLNISYLSYYYFYSYEQSYHLCIFNNINPLYIHHPFHSINYVIINPNNTIYHHSIIQMSYNSIHSSISFISILYEEIVTNIIIYLHVKYSSMS